MRTPFSAAALFTLTVGMTATAVAAAAEPGSLPALNLGPWQIGAQATRYSTEDESHRIDARLVHSSRYRQQFGVDRTRPGPRGIARALRPSGRDPLGRGPPRCGAAIGATHMAVTRANERRIRGETEASPNPGISMIIDATRAKTRPAT